MIDDHLSPEEQELIEQIQAVTRMKLESPSRENIREHMITEFRTVNATAPNKLIRNSRFSLPFIAAIAAAIFVFLVIVVSLLLNNQPPQSNVVQVFTETPTTDIMSAASPSATFTASIEPPVTETASPTSTFPVEPTDTITASAISIATATASLVSSPTVLPTLTDTLLPPPTATLATLVVVEGPITSITDNIITIYGFKIKVEAQHPILNIIEPGQVVRVQGTFQTDGGVLAEVVSNMPDTVYPNGEAATVRLEGPVEAINDNSITVNGIPVRLAASSDILQTIRVGDFVSVEGNFQTSGSIIVLVVVNIAIIETTVPENKCWYHDDAMGMGHWHCDGMGMGMGSAMGMGN